MLGVKQTGLSDNDLEVLLEGVVQPMLVHTNQYNAFQLSDELNKTRQGRAAKDGELAPDDIVVEKGETEFAPGPIVGELGAVGILAKIDKGKVVIQKTTTVVEAGQAIEGDLGMMLSKLGINPIEIGLILSGVLEEGMVMPAKSLNIDYDAFRTDVITAMSGAFNLACNISWFASETCLHYLLRQVVKHSTLQLKREFPTRRPSRYSCLAHIRAHWLLQPS